MLLLPKMRKLSGSVLIHLPLLLLIGSAKCEPQEGYFYPRPTPQCVPQVYTETVTDYATETLNHFFTDVNTVYLTDYLTSTVVNPVLITSTEYAVSTVFVPQLEYVTETSTLVLQPSPVVQYVTETVFSTVFAQGDFSGGAAVNTYLPPEPAPLPVPVPNPVIINNGLQVQHPPPPPPPYIPPPQVSLPPVLEHPVTHQPFLALDESFQGQRLLGAPNIGTDAFGGVHSLPNVHAVPPTYDEREGYRYKRKLAEETPNKSNTTTVSPKST